MLVERSAQIRGDALLDHRACEVDTSQGSSALHGGTIGPNSIIQSQRAGALIEPVGPPNGTGSNPIRVFSGHGIWKVHQQVQLFPFVHRGKFHSRNESNVRRTKLTVSMAEHWNQIMIGNRKRSQSGTSGSFCQGLSGEAPIR